MFENIDTLTLHRALQALYSGGTYSVQIPIPYYEEPAPMTPEEIAREMERMSAIVDSNFRTMYRNITLYGDIYPPVDSKWEEDGGAILPTCQDNSAHMYHYQPPTCDADKHNWMPASHWSVHAPAGKEVCTVCMSYRTRDDNDTKCEHNWETKWLFTSSYKQCTKCKEEQK